MSQICPSSSHQLVAAAIAFRRARRKFPRNYGTGLEGASGSSKPANMTKEEARLKSSCSSARCTCDLMSNHMCSTKSWSGEFAENASMQDNFFRKQIICKCCRKRDKETGANNRMCFRKRGEDCSSGDTIVTTAGIKCTKHSSEAANCPQNTTIHDRPADCRKRDVKNLSSNMDSLDLLHNGVCKESDHTDSKHSPNDRLGYEQLKNIKKEDSWISRRNSNNLRSSVSPSFSCFCNFHSARYLKPDMCQLPQKDIYHHTRHYHHSQNCCHRGHEHNSVSLKEDQCRELKAHVQPMQISLWKRCCHNEAYTKDKTLLGRAKDFEKEFLTAEENDEEHDDSVAVINHKDSLSILAEKYKVERNLKINKFPNEHETVKDTNKGGSKASLSHVVYDQEVDGIIDEKNSNVKEREKSADREVSKNVENARSYRHDCDQILKEGYNNRLKNLRSRLIKKDICCSAKGTPWRHTF